MKDAPNKMMKNSDVQEFHFAGTGVHAPISIKAATFAEAQEKYLKMFGPGETKKPGESESQE